MWSKRPRRSCKLHHRADVSFGTMTLALDVGLLDVLDRPASGISAGLRTSIVLARRGHHPVGDVRRGDQQVEVELALQPLADHLHVQEPQEAAAEAEAERLAGLRLVEQRGVVRASSVERVAQVP